MGKAKPHVGSECRGGRGKDFDFGLISSAPSLNFSRCTLPGRCGEGGINTTCSG